MTVSMPPPLPPGPPLPASSGRLWLAAVSDLLLAFLTGVVVLVGSGLVAAIAAGLAGDRAEFANGLSGPGPAILLGGMALACAAAALLPYLLRRRAGAQEIARAHAALARGATWGWIGVVLAGLLLGALLLDGIDRAWALGLAPSNAEPIAQMLLGHPRMMAAYVVVLAPVAEELLFRRVLFGRFLAAGRPWQGGLLSAAVFASLHEFAGVSDGGGLQTTVLWTFYFGMGAALAWVYRRTGSLWAPILVHAGNNAVALWMLSTAS